MLIDLIAGARPNFMKIAPIIRALKQADTAYRLIHTGQHFDKAMSEQFFIDLNMPEPDFNLGSGGGTQAEQTGRIMVGYEEVLKMHGNSDLCLVVGDVTSSMACAIVAKKAGIKVAHVEAGIRSGDMRMPEEINRIVTDSITDWFFTTTVAAGENLLKSGIASEDIFFVGNTMIDSLIEAKDRLRKPTLPSNSPINLNDNYAVLTLHRPSNVDDYENLFALLELINNELGMQILFPVHPRTRKVLESKNVNFSKIFYLEPMSYLEFIYLIKHAKAVITDSGGITEETTVLNVPCVTLRDSTERPETVTMGTNVLAGTNLDVIKKYLVELKMGNWKKGSIPDLWDGHTAERIVNLLNEKL